MLGEPLGSRAVRARLGFLPEHFRFHDWLTADEFLLLHGQLYGMDPRAPARRRSELLDLVGLAPFRRKTLRTFSKGMLQRIGLAQALLNEPALVFLDRAHLRASTRSGVACVRDIIRELRSRGTTVFLNSHLLSEVEITCDRVAFIKHGEVVRTSDLKTLVEGETRVTLRAAGLTPEILAGLGQLWATICAPTMAQVTLTVAGEAALPAVDRYLVCARRGCL